MLHSDVRIGVIFGTATLEFLLPKDGEIVEVAIDAVKASFAEHKQNYAGEDIRSFGRQRILDAFHDNMHVDPVKSQIVCSLLAWYVITSPAWAKAISMGNKPDGALIIITMKSAHDANFRIAIADAEFVLDEVNAVRKKTKATKIYTATKEDVEQAIKNKKRSISKDPSLDPPSKPRPDRWLPTLIEQEKRIGKSELKVARQCIEEGDVFVWRSRQIADESMQDIDESLSAMAEYDRLHLPYPIIFAETKDWIELYKNGLSEKTECRFAIAAHEENGRIDYFAWADYDGQIHLSSFKGVIYLKDIASHDNKTYFERSYIQYDRLSVPDDYIVDMGIERLITRTAGNCLLELLFLLSTTGVKRDIVRQGSGKSKKKQAGQRRMSERDYSIIRVPMSYVEDKSDNDAKSGPTGRWVRPHIRRAHMWGKYTRPITEQHWRESCLVGAAKRDDDQDMPRRIYMVN